MVDRMRVGMRLYPLAFLLVSNLMSAQTSATANGGVVLKSVANMYSNASTDADVVSQAIYGTNVTVLDSKSGWAKIRTPDEYTGWMEAGHLKTTDEPYASRGRVAQVVNLFANLYREPDVTKHQPLLTVPFETKLEVVSEPPESNQRWIQVRLADDRSAWVQRGDVGFGSRSMAADEVVEFSKKFLGLPYTWGGTSSFGYDCSGFTQMLGRRRGVLMPRDSGPQARWNGVIPVSAQRLQPGDLLYFGDSARKITHTGMYIGGGQFISATTHERPVVRIDRLDDPYWKKIYVAARRIK